MSRQSYLVKACARGPQRTGRWPQGSRGARLRNPDPATAVATVYFKLVSAVISKCLYSN